MEQHFGFTGLLKKQWATDLWEFHSKTENSSIKMLAQFQKKLVLEAAGAKFVKLVLSDDSRFIDTVILSHTDHKVFKKCTRDIVGIYPFPLHVRGVGDVVDFD